MDSVSDEPVAEELRRVYSETALRHILRPRNLGAMEHAHGFGMVTGPCGDTMKIWLRVENNTVMAATFDTDGCGATVAAGSMVTELATGKSISQALRISPQDILDALGGLPEGNAHCALLAVNTLRKAINDYITLKNEPWKRAYRTY